MCHVGFDEPSVWGARGRGFSMGVAAGAGRLVHLTGQVAWDADELIVGAGDVAAQAEQCFRNIEAMLAVVGGRLGDLVSVTTYYLRPGDLALIQPVRARFLTGDPLPVSTSVMVAGLGSPEFLVEMTPVAVIPDARFVTPT